MDTKSYAINIENLNKKYKDFRLHNINLQIASGTIMGFVGQNGAGKTTTIKALLNLIKKDSGSIKIFDSDICSNEIAIKNQIGVVFDELGLPVTLNCKKVNTIMKNIYTNWDSEQFYTLTKSFDLPIDKQFSKFSRGMQMKLQTAIALSHNAKLLILDEATSGLDPIARNELLDILLEFMEDESHSILMSSHITSDLERVADYITFIDNGSILLSDDKFSISENHAVAKGSVEVISSIPHEYIISTRKNAYGCEALVLSPQAVHKIYPELILDKASLDDILYFYAKRNKKEKATGNEV